MLNFTKLMLMNQLNYIVFKNKKMINGIPAILVYNNDEKDYFYIPDDSALSGNKEKIEELFKRIISKYQNNDN